MAACPLVFPALVVLSIVWFEWRTTRAVAWMALLCGFVLLTAAFYRLDFSAQDFVVYGSPWLSVTVSVARLLGAACFLWSVVRLLRAHQVPW